MNLPIFKIVVAISTLSVLVPLAIFIRGRSRFPKANKFVGLFLVVSLICDIAVNILFYQRKSNAIPVNLYYVASFILVSYFYFELIFKKRLKAVLISGTIAFTIALVWELSNYRVDQFQGTLWAIIALIVGGYGIVYIVNAHKMVLEKMLDKNLISYQIINASFIFYFLVTILLFLSTNFVFTHSDADISRIFWSLHNIANTLKNIGLAIGLYYTGKRDVKTTLLEIERISRERTGTPEDEFDSARFSN